MPKIIFLLIAVSMLLSGCGGPEGKSVFVPGKPDVPLVVFDSTEHDFGTVAAGSENTCTFAFINTGGQDLQIESLYAACGCTAATPADRTIKPGEASELTVSFTAGAYPGVQKKKITVVTNDPDNRQIDLWVKTDIQRNDAYAAQTTNNSSPETKASSMLPASPLSKSTRQSIRFLKNATN